MGRPVVSTSLGIEGLDVTDGEHFLRADSAEAFSRGILALLDDADLRGRIAGGRAAPDGGAIFLVQCRAPVRSDLPRRGGAATTLRARRLIRVTCRPERISSTLRKNAP